MSFDTMLTSLACVQNPVNTFGWLTCNCQMLGPMITLGVDTHLFVQPVTSSRPYMCVSILYFGLTTLAIMAGPVPSCNIFQLALFPQSFRFQMEWHVMVGAVGFAVALRTMRAVLDRCVSTQVNSV